MTRVYTPQGTPVTLYDTAGVLVFGATPEPPEPGWWRQPVTDRTQVPMGIEHISEQGTTQATYRTPHRVRVTGDTPQVTYSNLRFAGGVRPGLNPVHFAASIEARGQLYPLTFEGAETVTVPGGEHAVSDPLDTWFTAGETIYVRTWIGVDVVGERWSLAYQDVLNPDEGAGRDWGVNLTRSGIGPISSTGPVVAAATPDQMGVFPVAITALTTEPRPAIVLAGSSSTAGAGDRYRAGKVRSGGFGVRAADLGNLPYVMAAQGSDAYYLRTEQIDAMHYPSPVLEGATHVIGNMGANDAALGQPLPTMQTDAIRYWQRMAVEGPGYWQCTITPYTTSTDNWQTVAGQTPHASEPVRAGFNDWIRDGAPMVDGGPAPVGAAALRAGEDGHPLAGWVETADLVETSRNSGLWVVDPVKGAASTDGIHHHPWVHELIAAVIATTLGLV